MSQNDEIVLILPAKIKIYLNLAKKYWQIEIKPILQCAILHEN